jgi:hypothetical protein
LAHDTEGTTKGETDSPSLNKQDLGRLKSPFDSSKPFVSCSLAMIRRSLCYQYFTVCDSVPKNVRILDSDATDHVTFISTLFFPSTFPPNIHHFVVAGGSHALVVGS